VDDAASEQSPPAPTVGENVVANVDANSAIDPGAQSETPPEVASASETLPADGPVTDPAAIAVSTTVEPTLPPASAGTKHAAWVLGSKFCLAALANDGGAVPEDVTKWFEEAKLSAESLNVPLADLPKQPATPNAQAPSSNVLEYIVKQEKAIGDRLAADRDEQHAAIFRMAVRSNLLLMLNTPGSRAVETLSKSLAELGPRTGLPQELWQPLLDLLAQSATPAAIREAVPQMHADVEQHLAAERSSE
jgi:hypothetical protein